MFTGRSSALVQMHTKNNTINSKIASLQVAYEIRNQFDIGLNATYAKLSGKCNEVPKWSGSNIETSTSDICFGVKLVNKG